MVRVALLAAAGVWVLTMRTMAGSKPSPGARTAFVELDAVVLDKNDRPVKGLQRGDFQIKEDGRPVAVTSFTEVNAAGIAGQADGRSVVLLLDDNAVPLSATLIVQNIAKLFMSAARPADTVAVVRLTHRQDAGREAASRTPDRTHRRISSRVQSLSFFGRDMRDDLLVDRGASRAPAGCRSAIGGVLVCIVTRGVCGTLFRATRKQPALGAWRDAMTATARANASVYAVSPAGVESRIDLGDGLVDNSGGGDFARSNDFRRAAGMIWDEAGHYYLLGYTPTARSREKLHTD